MRINIKYQTLPVGSDGSLWTPPIRPELLDGQLTDEGVPDGHLAIQKPNGMFAELQPDGVHWGEAPTPNGVFAQCDQGNANLLNFKPYSDRPGVHPTYGILYHEI